LVWRPLAPIFTVTADFAVERQRTTAENRTVTSGTLDRNPDSASTRSPPTTAPSFRQEKASCWHRIAFRSFAAAAPNGLCRGHRCVDQPELEPAAPRHHFDQSRSVSRTRHPNHDPCRTLLPHRRPPASSSRRRLRTLIDSSTARKRDCGRGTRVRLWRLWPLSCASAVISGMTMPSPIFSNACAILQCAPLDHIADQGRH
jgi:hypothetical protein